MARWRTPVVLALLCVSLGLAAVPAAGQVHGSSRLDIYAFPIPCTVIDIFKLDTPCERTLLSFDIESITNLNITISGMVVTIDSAIGIAGPEHLIIQEIFNLGAVTIHPEMWFATPFETVLDANSQPNVVVIPPGEPLFVKKRLTTILNIAGITLTNLAMFEDVNFPNPGADFGPLIYPAQSQSFGFGDIVTLTGQTVSGITITSTTGFCATLAANTVKKHSAPGSVNPACTATLGGILVEPIEGGAKTPILFDFENISIGGLSVGGVSAGASLNFRPLTGLQFGTSLNYPFMNIATLAFSFSYSAMGGITADDAFAITLASAPLNISLSFAGLFELSSANLSFSNTQTLGGLRVSFTGSASVIKDQGLSSVTAGVALTSGTFSANQSVAFTRQVVGFDPMGDPIFGLGFSRLGVNISLRLSPATFTLSATFGKGGLSQLGIISGFVF